jgi:ubiquinone/menaquinone biosynthesis C-methylase UbiE
LADTFINRKTDLNDASIDVILKNILGGSVIDVGCGKGYLIQQISAHHTAGSCYTGYDVATEPADTDKIHFVKGSVMSIPFPDKSFDTVVCTHTLEHIRNPEKALKELRRITARRLIVVVPRQREYKYTFDLHINFYPYLYSFVNFIGNKNARFFECAGDMIAIEDVQP